MQKRLGAGFGRLFGEVIHRSFPDGIRNDQMHFVYPGIYSLVGAAAFCGGFTHTISPAIMIFEMTNQLVPVLPVLTAVLISTAICSFFQPSFYESLIQLKNLPFLADIPPSTNCHGIIAQQFMIKNEAYLTPKSTYVDAKKILDEHTYLKVIPVIENLRTKLLLGTLNRHNLELIINQLISTDKRHAEAAKRMKILSKVFSFKSNRYAFNFICKIKKILELFQANQILQAVVLSQFSKMLKVKQIWKMSVKFQGI